ncbi:hypothetical protein V8C35DRAFT_286248 [Trichoderma chlorosporum]
MERDSHAVECDCRVVVCAVLTSLICFVLPSEIIPFIFFSLLGLMLHCDRMHRKKGIPYTFAISFTPCLAFIPRFHGQLRKNVSQAPQDL